MIKLLQEGSYELIETVKQTKILILDFQRTLAWINAKEIGEILVVSHKPHKTDAVLARGHYRLYEVKNEPRLTDLLHLELLVGDGKWQGYLLPTGLPTEEKKRNRIILSKEIITKSAW